VLLIVGLGLLCGHGRGSAADWSAWQRAYDSAAGVRFIPVELWTGAEWDGSHVVAMTPASLRFGGRSNKSVSGPIDWLPSGGGAPVKVYERLNQGKRQLFALTSDATGLGRVFDSRYRNYDCVGEVKFPLGYWKQGEVREYRVACRGGAARRTCGTRTVRSAVSSTSQATSSSRL
jgi:hypothetical protein